MPALSLTNELRRQAKLKKTKSSFLVPYLQNKGVQTIIANCFDIIMSNNNKQLLTPKFVMLLVNKL